MRNRTREKEKRHRPYSELVFKEAISAVKLKHMTCHRAAKKYGIPRSTLYANVNNLTSGFTNIGNKSMLSKSEEESLANYMRWCEDRYIPFTYLLLKAFVREILKRKQSKKDIKVCQSWCQEFAVRHGFSSRKPRQIEASRSVAAASPDSIIEYYSMLKERLSELDLLDKPSHVWNCDEKGWSKEQSIQQPILVTKGKKQAKIKQIFTTDHITTMHCINANGDLLKNQYILFKNNVPTTMNLEYLPENLTYGATDSGFFNADVFFLWFRDVFVKSLPRARPQLLVFDGASCHISVQLIEFAKESDIDIISLPAKTTAFLQPVDQILSNLTNKFTEEAIKNCFCKFDFLVRPNNFPGLLNAAQRMAWTKDLVKSAFKKTGLFPPSLVEMANSHQITDSCRSKIQAYIQNDYEMPVEQEPEEEDLGDHDVGLDTDSLPPPPEPQHCKECQRPINNPCKSCIKREKLSSNVLYKQGLIDAELVDILDPPEIPLARSRSRLTKAKHVTGQELLQERKEKERERIEKEKRKEERQKKKSIQSTDSCLEDCTDDLPEILPPKRKRKNSGFVQSGMKSVTVSSTRTSARASNRINYAALNEGTVVGEIIEIENLQKNVEEEPIKCPACSLPENKGDDPDDWIGCDICPRWWHYYCLSPFTRAAADISLLTGEVFRCDKCPVERRCAVCLTLGTDENDFAQCANCTKLYHPSCVSADQRTEFYIYKQNNRPWFCGQCFLEE